MDHQQSPLQIGLVQAFGTTPSRGPAYLRDFAQATEAVGFHSLWMPEHIVFFEQYQSVYPYPPHPGSSERPTLPVGKRAGLFDPLLACQAAAMHTTTLRVGTAVALLPLRHPLLWAREVATLDHFSAGRFEFGIGIGWLAEEFAALNVDFSTRGRLSDEYLAALHAAWSQQESTFHGEFVNFTGALSFPKPVQARPPILIGGESTAALRRVARYGDGWYGWNITPAQLDAALTQLDMQLEHHQFIDGRISNPLAHECECASQTPVVDFGLFAAGKGAVVLGVNRVQLDLGCHPAGHALRDRELLDVRNCRLL